MIRSMFIIRVLFALLVLGVATIELAQASPAAPSWKIADTTYQHIAPVTYSLDIPHGCDDNSCRTAQQDCGLLACGAQSCGFSAVEPRVGSPGTIGFTFARWHLPREEAVAGLVPHGDPRPPKYLA